MSQLFFVNQKIPIVTLESKSENKIVTNKRGSYKGSTLEDNENVVTSPPGGGNTRSLIVTLLTS